MKDIEDRLRELGDRAEGWNPNDSLPGSARSAIKRHRKTSALAGGIVASSLVIGIASLVPRDAGTVPPAGNPSVAAESPETSTPEDQEPDIAPDPLARDDFFGAVWPEDDRAETEQGCSEPDSFRTGALGTAREFGRAVLGWDEANGVARGEYGNSIQIELTRSGSASADTSTSSAVDLSLVEYVEGCWSVQSVSPTDTTTPAVTVPVTWRREVKENAQTNVISTAFDPPQGARGRIELAYGDQVENRRFTAQDISLDRPLTFRLGAIDPYEGGHVLILFEDSDGTVTTAIGVPLNPQKGGARADGLP